jgi:hypothetical protein
MAGKSAVAHALVHSPRQVPLPKRHVKLCRTRPLPRGPPPPLTVVPSPRREMTPRPLIKRSRAPHACAHTPPPLTIATVVELPCPLDFHSRSATQVPPLEPTRASTASRCPASPPPLPEREPRQPQPACSAIRNGGSLLRPNLCISSTLGALPSIPKPLPSQERC